MYWLTEEKDQVHCAFDSLALCSDVLRFKVLPSVSHLYSLAKRQFNLELPLSTVHVDKRVPKKKDHFSVHA